MSRPKWMVPISYSGNLLDFTYTNYPNIDTPPNPGDHPWESDRRVGKWLPPDAVFKDTLKFDHWSQGRSAVTIILSNTQGNKYPMMASRFFETCIDRMVNGYITGTWGFIKRGANYSLVLKDV